MGAKTVKYHNTDCMQKFSRSRELPWHCKNGHSNVYKVLVRDWFKYNVREGWSRHWVMGIRCSFCRGAPIEAAMDLCYRRELVSRSRKAITNDFAKLFQCSLTTAPKIVGGNKRKLEEESGFAYWTGFETLMERLFMVPKTTLSPAGI